VEGAEHVVNIAYVKPWVLLGNQMGAPPTGFAVEKPRPFIGGKFVDVHRRILARPRENGHRRFPKSPSRAIDDARPDESAAKGC
jgi:hypothetical protein